MGVNLSYSAAQKYKQSPRAWYLHYQLRLRPEELSSPLFFGNSMDIAFNALLEQKRRNDPIDIVEAKNKFLDAWAKAEVDGETINLFEKGKVKFSKTDLDVSVLTDEDQRHIDAFDIGWLCLQRKGLMMIEAYAEQVIPRINKVHFVQKGIKIKNDAGDAFTGFIDFCATFDDHKTYIVDNKTSSIKYADDSVMKSEQLATYFEAMRDELTIDGAAYVVIPKKFRKHKLPLVPIDIKFGGITEELINNTFTAYDEVLTGIKLGQFECGKNLEGGCCSQPWGCPYKRYCDSGGKDLTGLKYFKERK